MNSSLHGIRYVFIAFLLTVCWLPTAALAKPCPNPDCKAEIPPGAAECPECYIPADATPEQMEQWKRQRQSMEAQDRPPEKQIHPQGEHQTTVKGEFLKVGGTTELPDGALISGGIIFNSERNDPFEVFEFEVQGGRLEWTGGPYDKPLPAGFYFLDVHFDLSDHLPDFRKAFEKKFGDRWEEYQLINDRVHFQVGTDSQRDQQDTDDKEYFLASLDKCGGLMGELSDAYYAAALTRFDNDQEAWKGWLSLMEYVRPGDFDTPEAYEDEIKRLAADQRFNDGGKLDVAPWRKFIDEDFRGRVAELFKGHEEFTGRFAAQRYPKANNNLTHIIGSLITLSASWSRDLYRENDLDLADEDVSGPHWAVMEDRQVSTSYLEGQVEWIFHYVGLDDYLRAKEEAKSGH